MRDNDLGCPIQKNYACHRGNKSSSFAEWHNKKPPAEKLEA